MQRRHAFDVPDVYDAEYIPCRYYSAEITLSPGLPAYMLTFDARRLFANRFRREFMERNQSRAVYIGYTS